MRFIPRKTKVKTTIFRNFTILDVALMLVGCVIAVLLATSNIFDYWLYNLWLALGAGILWAVLFFEMSDGLRVYNALVLSFRYLAYHKSYSKKNKGDTNIKNIMPFDDLNTDKFLKFGDYYGMVVEILPMSFGLLAEERQNQRYGTRL